MVPLGFYFVHRAALDCGDVSLDTFRARDTLTTYPQFLRYQLYQADGIYFILNACGSLIVIQPIINAKTIEEAEYYYENIILFDQAYSSAIISASSHFGFRQKDFADSSLVWFGAAETKISWRRTDLQVTENNPWEISIFVEFLLIFSVLKLCSAVLEKQLNNASNLATDNFITSSKDLIWLENPSDILVNEDEITLLSSFYERWGISRDAKSIQVKFSQVITVLSLHASKVQSNHAIALNLLVGCATVLALLSVADPLSELFDNAIASKNLKIGTLIVSFFLAATALMRGRLPWVRERTSKFIAKRTIRRRLVRLVPVAERQKSCPERQSGSSVK